MTPEEKERRTVALMKQKIRAYVKTNGDTLQAFEMRLFYSGWFKSVGGRVRLHIEALYEVLNAIKEDPVDFFREAFGETAPGVGSSVEPQRAPDSGARKKPLEMTRAAANFLLAVGRGTPRRTLLSWRSDVSKARFASLLEAASKAGLDELRFLVEALSRFAMCGEDVARLAAKVLGTKRERFTRQIYMALEALHIALGEQVEIPKSTPTEETPEQFLPRFRELWAKRSEGVGTLGREWLEEMDERRYTNAPSVVVEFDRRLEEIDSEQVPRALGILGSALRMARRNANATAAISAGISLANAGPEAGQLHQRMSMVLWSKPDYEAALTENCRAIASHRENQNLPGVTRALVDRGVILSSMGVLGRSTNSYRIALDNLPQSDRRNRAAALHGLARNLISANKPKEAVPLLEEAGTIPLDPLESSKLEWAYGCALSLAGNHEAGEERLAAAVRTLLPISPIEAALAEIDLSSLLIRARRPAEAYLRARGMLKFEAILGTSPIAQAAVVERLPRKNLPLPRERFWNSGPEYKKGD